MTALTRRLRPLALSAAAFTLTVATTAALVATPSRPAHAAPPKHEGSLTLLLVTEPTALVTVSNVATPILSVSAKVTEGQIGRAHV